MHMVAPRLPMTTARCAFRYPRGEGVGVEMPEIGLVLEIGKGRIMREGAEGAFDGDAGHLHGSRVT
jgi:1-deoxy-D-xylulose-5-phosphate synthase